MSETVPEIRISTDPREVEKLSRDGFKLREVVTPYSSAQGEQASYILERGSEASTARAWAEVEEYKQAAEAAIEQLTASNKRVSELEATERRINAAYEKLGRDFAARGERIAEFRDLRDKAVARGTAIEKRLGQARTFFGDRGWAEFEEAHPPVQPEPNVSGLRTPTQEEITAELEQAALKQLGLTLESAQGTTLDQFAQFVGLERKIGPSGAAESDVALRTRTQLAYDQHDDESVHREAAERIARQHNVVGHIRR